MLDVVRLPLDPLEQPQRHAVLEDALDDGPGQLRARGDVVVRRGAVQGHGVPEVEVVEDVQRRLVGEDLAKVSASVFVRFLLREGSHCGSS